MSEMRKCINKYCPVDYATNRTKDPCKSCKYNVEIEFPKEFKDIFPGFGNK